MSDASIKAALEAAGEATYAAMVAGHHCSETGVCRKPCECASACAAAAIAAFLRALPELTEGGGPALYHSAGLATAVKRAAGGGG
jgi:hypothetical protein